MDQKNRIEQLENRIKELEAESSRRKRAEEINRVLFRISSAINTTTGLEELYGSIHRSLGSIIDTTNFYIALHDKAEDTFTFPYCVDEKDGHYSPSVKNVSKSASLTAEVIRTATPMIVTAENRHLYYNESKGMIPDCTPSIIWLGVPLIHGNIVMGVMTVQSYDDPDLYDETDMHVMLSVADQVALAIECKRAEEAFRESTERYRAHALATFEAVFISEKGICLDTNQAAVEMFGYSYNELIGIHGTDVIAPESRELVGQNMMSCNEEPYEAIGLKKDGSRFFAEIRGKKIDYKGKDARITVVRDIDKQKKAMASLKQREAALRSIFLAAPTGIGVTVDRVFRKVNDRLCEMVGYTPEELLGQSTRLIYPTESEFERVGRELYGQVHSKGSGTCEAKCRRKDGTLIDMFLSANTIDPMDHSAGNTFTALDITERNKAEKEKEILQTRLRHSHKMEALGTLAGGIAHDFNNLLGVIIGNAEMAVDDLPESSTAHSNLEEIKIAGLRAGNVVRQLLSFSRKIEQERKPIKIQPIIEEVIGLLRASMPATIEIRQDIPGRRGTIKGDPTQIHQLLLNLFTNAAHAMENSVGTLTVSLRDVLHTGQDSMPITGMESKPYVELTVRDTGCGIDPAIKDRIFDPYFTTKEVGKGTGMGLSVVHGIVKNHEGLISVNSVQGEGTAVTVLFPIIDESPATHRDVRGELPKGDERILLIDDETSLVKLLRMMLERLGYTVESNTCPLEALEHFRENKDRYDLIITDMTMPQMTGEQLVGAFLTINPGIPVILCSGFSKRIGRKTVIDMGASEYIAKPVNLGTLARVVRGVLDGKPYVSDQSPTP